MATYSVASTSSTPFDSTLQSFDRAIPQDQAEKTHDNDESQKVDKAPSETVAKPEDAAGTLQASTASSMTTSTSNVAKADQNDWDLLLSALISKHSTSLSNDDYLKLCESSSNLKTITAWHEYYKKNSRLILAVLKCRCIVGPAQFAQSPQSLAVVAPLVDSPRKVRTRSRVPLSHPAVRGLDIS